MWRLPFVIAAIVLAVLAIASYNDAQLSRAQTQSPSISLDKDETIGDGNPAGDLIGVDAPAIFGVTIITTGPADRDVHLQILGPAICEPTWASPLDQHPDVLMDYQISKADISNVSAATVVVQYSINCQAAGDYTFQITADVTSESVPVDPQPNDNQAENHVHAHVDCDPDGDGVCSQVDNCPTTANANQADSDGDGYGNACETAACVTVINHWTVPPNDTDCDGYPDSILTAPRGPETVIGTNAGAKCASTPTANDEPLPDKWPVDFNDNQIVNGADWLAFNVYLGPDPLPYRARFDLNANGMINGADLLQLIPFMNKRCSP